MDSSPSLKTQAQSSHTTDTCARYIARASTRSSLADLEDTLNVHISHLVNTCSAVLRVDEGCVVESHINMHASHVVLASRLRHLQTNETPHNHNEHVPTNSRNIRRNIIGGQMGGGGAYERGVGFEGLRDLCNQLNVTWL